MLVLSRKVGERIIIGDSVVLCILECERNRVRLGIEAPQEVRILREEVRARPRNPNGEPLVKDASASV